MQSLRRRAPTSLSRSWRGGWRGEVERIKRRIDWLEQCRDNLRYLRLEMERWKVPALVISLLLSAEAVLTQEIILLMERREMRMLEAYR